MTSIIRNNHEKPEFSRHIHLTLKNENLPDMLINKMLLFLIGAFFLVNCSTKNERVITPTETNAKNVSATSVITCPKCGHKKQEILPTDVCLIRYTCEKCRTEMLPQNGDCCVFCTYGTHKCPSMQ